MAFVQHKKGLKWEIKDKNVHKACKKVCSSTCMSRYPENPNETFLQFLISKKLVLFSFASIRVEKSNDEI